MLHIEEPRINMIYLAAFNGHNNIICRLFISNKSIISHPDNIGMDIL